MWRHPFLAACAVYLVATVALTHAVLRSPADVVAPDPQDPVQCLWILWWSAQRLPFTQAWWDAPAFYPTRDVLALSEHLAGVSLLTSPLQWLGASPVLAYNTAFALSYPLSAVSAHLLCLWLTRRHDTATLGGLAFGFAPYRATQVAHIHVLWAFWVPLALLGLHRFLDDGRKRWLLLFGAAYALQGTTNGYLLLYSSVLLSLWMAWFVLARRRWRDLAAVLLAWAAAASLLVPGLLKYREVHQRHGLTRDLAEVVAYSPPLEALLQPPFASALWTSPWRGLGLGAEGEIYPGALVVGLVALGWSRGRRASRDVASGWARPFLAGLAALFALVASTPSLLGPWKLALGPFRLSVSVPHKPISLSLLCLALLVLSSARIRGAARRSSALAFYGMASVALTLLALGPRPRVLDQPLLYEAPYAWLMRLPGFPALRVPARFALLSALCLAVAAAVACTRLLPAARACRSALVGALGLGLLADGWATLQSSALPSRSPLLESLEAGFVLELPLDHPARDAAALFRAIYHGRPVINGSSSYFPPHHQLLRAVLGPAELSLLDGVAALGPTTLVLHHDGDPDGAWRRALALRADVRELGQEDAWSVYALAARAAPSVRVGRPLPIAAAETSLGSAALRACFDGDLRSVWSSGQAQAGGEEIQLDLGTPRRIEAVQLSLGRFVDAYPRELLIEASTDGRNWVPAWAGGGAQAAFHAAIEEPKAVPLYFGLGGRTARFLRLRQVAEGAAVPWIVAELAVLGAPE